MKKGTEPKGYNLGNNFSSLIPHQALEVYVLMKKVMDWLIPFTVILFKAGRVPPRLEKLPIVEFCNFCKKVSEALKDNMEDHQNESHAWQCVDSNEFNQIDLAAHVDIRQVVLSPQDVGAQHSHESNHKFVHHVPHSYFPSSPRVLLVDQPGGEHEESEISDSHVQRVVRQGSLILFLGLSRLESVVSVCHRVGVHLKPMHARM